MPHIAYIDTIDACHLKCPTCIRGVRGMRNTSSKMPMDLFEKVVAKVKSENYSRVGLYSWTEPFLNQTLHDYIRVVKSTGLACDISTTLSIRHIRHLENVLCSGVDEIIVSLSGADQETYQRNHVGGNLNYALSNLQRIREIIDRRALSIKIRMRLIRFHYNADAEKPLNEIATGLRFNFETIQGGGNPDIKPSSVLGQTPESFEHQIVQAKAMPVSVARPGEVCSLALDQLTIDCAGDVHLCCAFPNYEALKIGHYLDLPETTLLAQRHAHPFCRICTMPRRGITPEDEARLSLAIPNIDLGPKVAASLAQ